MSEFARTSGHVGADRRCRRHAAGAADHADRSRARGYAGASGFGGAGVADRSVSLRVELPRLRVPAFQQRCVPACGAQRRNIVRGYGQAAALRDPAAMPLVPPGRSGDLPALPANRHRPVSAERRDAARGVGRKSAAARSASASYRRGGPRGRLIFTAASRSPSRHGARLPRRGSRDPHQPAASAGARRITPTAIIYAAASFAWLSLWPRAFSA